MMKRSYLPNPRLLAITLACVTAACFSMPLFGQDTDETKEPSKWESAMQAFERQDQETPFEPGGVLFLGSSSIRMWNLKKSFPDLDAVNRGFGGSEISDSIEFFDRIVTPRAPRLIIFYAGDNDIAKGKSAEQVSNDFKTFLTLIRKRLPETRLVYVPIKPSIARWALFEKMSNANSQIAAQIEKDDLAEYLKIEEPMMTEEGQPNPDLFLGDGLHLNENGYAIWNELLAPLLDAPEEE